MVLPREKPSTVAVRLGNDWWAPLGGVLICACGAFSLIGFPLDDVWHRLFGQDVTLWGPTHLMLIGGAAMTLVGIAVLSVEGMRATTADDGTPGAEPAHTKMPRAVALTGGLMLGLSTFQAEFDFGVPQFQLIFQPLMLMVAAGVGLVLARMYAGPGAALGAAGFFILLRGGLALLVGPVLGQTTAALPALHRRGGGGRGGGPLRLHPPAAAIRTRRRGRDRHHRPRRRVGLVPSLDASPLARGRLP